MVTRRNTKNSPLTHEELDENFRELRYDTSLQRVLENGNTTSNSIELENLSGITNAELYTTQTNTFNAIIISQNTYTTLPTTNVDEVFAGTDHSYLIDEVGTVYQFGDFRNQAITYEGFVNPQEIYTETITTEISAGTKDIIETITDGIFYFSSGTGTGPNGGFKTQDNLKYLSFTGSSDSFAPGNTRVLTSKTLDLTTSTFVTINAIKGSLDNGGHGNYWNTVLPVLIDELTDFRNESLDNFELFLQFSDDDGSSWTYSEKINVNFDWDDHTVFIPERYKTSQSKIRIIQAHILNQYYQHSFYRDVSFNSLYYFSDGYYKYFPENVGNQWTEVPSFGVKSIKIYENISKGYLTFSDNVFSYKKTKIGNGFTVALRSDGLVFYWGDLYPVTLNSNTLVEPTQLPINGSYDKKFIDLAVGNESIYLIDENKHLWVLGNNDFGQLGINNTTHQSNEFIELDGIWDSIYASRNFVFGIRDKEYTLWSWGQNDWGQLGTGNRLNVSSPVLINGPREWDKVFLGYDSSYAKEKNGTLWFFGNDTKTKSGITTESLNAQYRINDDRKKNEGLKKVVSTNDEHSFGISNNNILYRLTTRDANTSGIRNKSTIFTTNNYEDYDQFPWQVYDNKQYIELFDGHQPTRREWIVDYYLSTLGNSDCYPEYVNYAIDIDKKLYAIESHYSNARAGIITSPIGLNWNEYFSTPVQVTSPGSDLWKTGTVGNWTNFGIKDDGTLWTWGKSAAYYNNFGDPEHIWNGPEPISSFSNYRVRFAYISSPVLIDSGNWKSIFTGHHRYNNENLGYSRHFYGAQTTLAIKEDDKTLWGWGRNRINALFQSNDPIIIKDISQTNKIIAVDSWGTAGAANTGINGGPYNNTAPSLWSSWDRGGFVIDSKKKLFGWGAGHKITPSEPIGAPGALFFVVDQQYARQIEEYDWIDFMASGSEQINTSFPQQQAIATSTGTYLGYKGQGLRLGITAEGEMYGWGYNLYGGAAGFGVGNYLSRAVRVREYANTSIYDIKWAKVSNSKSNFEHNAAIDQNGSLYIWGRGTNYKLGTGSTASINYVTANKHERGTNWFWGQVSCGRECTAAIRNDGTLWFTGEISGSWKPSTFTQVGTDSDWIYVVCGYKTILAQKSNGQVYSFGWGNQVASGLVDYNTHRLRTSEPSGAQEGELIGYKFLEPSGTQTTLDDVDSGTINSSVWDTTGSNTTLTPVTSGTGTGSTGGFVASFSGNYHYKFTGTGDRKMQSVPLDLTGKKSISFDYIVGLNTNGAGETSLPSPYEYSSITSSNGINVLFSTDSGVSWQDSTGSYPGQLIGYKINLFHSFSSAWRTIAVEIPASAQTSGVLVKIYDGRTYGAGEEGINEYGIDNFKLNTDFNYTTIPFVFKDFSIDIGSNTASGILTTDDLEFYNSSITTANTNVATIWGRIHDEYLYNTYRGSNVYVPSRIQLNDVENFSVAKIQSLFRFANNKTYTLVTNTARPYETNPWTNYHINTEFKKIDVEQIDYISQISEDRWQKAEFVRNMVIGLKEDGTLWSWGWNDNGKAGNGSAPGLGPSPTPNQMVQVNSLETQNLKWTDFTSSANTVHGITEDNRLWNWGTNGSFEEFGDGNTSTTLTHLQPIQIGGYQSEYDWYKVSGHNNSRIALKKDGSAWHWGREDNVVTSVSSSLISVYNNNITSWSNTVNTYPYFGLYDEAVTYTYTSGPLGSILTVDSVDDHWYNNANVNFYQIPSSNIYAVSANYGIEPPGGTAHVTDYKWRIHSYEPGHTLNYSPASNNTGALNNMGPMNRPGSNYHLVCTGKPEYKYASSYPHTGENYILFEPKDKLSRISFSMIKGNNYNGLGATLQQGGTGTKFLSLEVLEGYSQYSSNDYGQVGNAFRMANNDPWIWPRAANNISIQTVQYESLEFHNLDDPEWWEFANIQMDTITTPGQNETWQDYGPFFVGSYNSGGMQTWIRMRYISTEDDSSQEEYYSYNNFAIDNVNFTWLNDSVYPIQLVDYNFEQFEVVTWNNVASWSNTTTSFYGQSSSQTESPILLDFGWESFEFPTLVDNAGVPYFKFNEITPSEGNIYTRDSFGANVSATNNGLMVFEDDTNRIYRYSLSPFYYHGYVSLGSTTAEFGRIDSAGSISAVRSSLGNVQLYNNETGQLYTTLNYLEFGNSSYNTFGKDVAVYDQYVAIIDTRYVYVYHVGSLQKVCQYYFASTVNKVDIHGEHLVVGVGSNVYVFKFLNYLNEQGQINPGFQYSYNLSIPSTSQTIRINDNYIAISYNTFYGPTIRVYPIITNSPFVIGNYFEFPWNDYYESGYSPISNRSFGLAMELSDKNILVTSEPRAVNYSNTAVGVVLVYDLDIRKFSYAIENPNPPEGFNVPQSDVFGSSADFFGKSLSINPEGTQLIIGAPVDNYYSVNKVGKVYVYRLGSQYNDKNWIDISSGMSNGLAVKNDGTLWGWGENKDVRILLDEFELNDASTPVQLSSSGATDIAIGDKHLGYLKGSLYVWGENDWGQLGTGTTYSTSTPTSIGVGFEKIFFGQDRSFGVKTDGTLWAWGRNTYRELGIGSGTLPVSSPVQAGSTIGWKYVDAKAPRLTVGVDSNNQVRKWGQYISGPPPYTTPITSAPTLDSDFGTNIEKVAVVPKPQANTIIFALDTSGNLFAKGTNSERYFGFWEKNYDIAQINSGNHLFYGHSTDFFIDSSGNLFAWGSNDSHGLAIGSSDETLYYSTPVQVGSGFKTVASAPSTTHLYSSYDNSTFCPWNSANRNKDGKNIINPTTGVKFLPGSQTFYGISNVGNLMVWGSCKGFNTQGTNIYSNVYSSPTILDNTHNWTQASLGTNLFAAIDSNGYLFLRGDNYWYDVPGWWGYYMRDTIGRPWPPLKDLKQHYRDHYGLSSSTVVHLNDLLFHHTPEDTLPVNVYWGYNFNKSSFTQIGTDTWQKCFVSYNYPRIPLNYNLTGSFFGIFANGGDDYVDENTFVPSDDIFNTFGGKLYFNNLFAIKSDGTLWVAGPNCYGELGVGDIQPRSVLTQVGSSTWSHITSVQGTTLGIRSDGTLWSWGRNTFGCLGLGQEETVLPFVSSPTQVGTSNAWKDVKIFTHSESLPEAQASDGYLIDYDDDYFTDYWLPYHPWPVDIVVYAVKTEDDGNDKIYGWGYNRYVTTDTTDFSYTGSTLFGKTYITTNSYNLDGSGVANVTSPDSMDVRYGEWPEQCEVIQLGDKTALLRDKFSNQNTRIYWGTSTWGLQSVNSTQTSVGQPGSFLGDFEDYVTTQEFKESWPIIFRTDEDSVIQIAPQKTWLDIESGNNEIYAVESGTGDIYRFGYMRGPLIKGSGGFSNVIPTYFTSGYGIDQSYFGLKTGSLDYDVYAWGSPRAGKLGNGEHSAITVSDASPFVWTTEVSKILSTDTNTLYLTSSGQVYTLGVADSIGYLGNGKVKYSLEHYGEIYSYPVQIGDDTNWSNVKTGNYHAAALKEDGTLWTWGLGANYKLGLFGSSNRSSPTQVTEGPTTGSNYWSTIEDLDSSKTLTKRADDSLWISGTDDLTLYYDSLYYFDLIGNYGGLRNVRQLPERFGKFKKIVSLRNLVVAISKDDGSLWYWGKSIKKVPGIDDNSTWSEPSRFTFSSNFDKKRPKPPSIGWTDVHIAQVYGTDYDGSLSTNDATCYFNMVALHETEGAWIWSKNWTGEYGYNDTTSMEEWVTEPINQTKLLPGDSGANFYDISKLPDPWSNDANTTLGKGIVETQNWKTGNYWKKVQVGIKSAEHLNSNWYAPNFTNFYMDSGEEWHDFTRRAGYVYALDRDNNLWVWGGNYKHALGKYWINDHFGTVDSYLLYNESSIKFISLSTRALPPAFFGLSPQNHFYHGADYYNHSSTPVLVGYGYSETSGSNWTYNIDEKNSFDLGVKDFCLSYTLDNIILTLDNKLWTPNTNSGLTNSGHTEQWIYRDYFLPRLLISENVEKIFSGVDNFAMIKEDGTLWMWGYGTYGKLGTNSTTYQSTPTLVYTPINNWKTIYCGENHTIGVTEDNYVYGWGKNENGTLAQGDIGDNEVYYSTPVLINYRNYFSEQQSTYTTSKNYISVEKIKSNTTGTISIDSTTQLYGKDVGSIDVPGFLTQTVITTKEEETWIRTQNVEGTIYYGNTWTHLDGLDTTITPAKSNSNVIIQLSLQYDYPITGDGYSNAWSNVVTWDNSKINWSNTILQWSNTSIWQNTIDSWTNTVATWDNVSTGSTTDVGWANSSWLNVIVSANGPGTGTGGAAGSSVNSFYHLEYEGAAGSVREYGFYDMGLSVAPTKVKFKIIKGNGTNGLETPDANEYLLVQVRSYDATLGTFGNWVTVYTDETDFTRSSLFSWGEETVSLIHSPTQENNNAQHIRFLQLNHSGLTYDNYAIDDITFIFDTEVAAFGSGGQEILVSDFENNSLQTNVNIVIQNIVWTNTPLTWDNTIDSWTNTQIWNNVQTAWSNVWLGGWNNVSTTNSTFLYETNKNYGEIKIRLKKQGKLLTNALGVTTVNSYDDTGSFGISETRSNYQQSSWLSVYHSNTEATYAVSGTLTGMFIDNLSPEDFLYDYGTVSYTLEVGGTDSGNFFRILPNSTLKVIEVPAKD